MSSNEWLSGGFGPNIASILPMPRFGGVIRSSDKHTVKISKIIYGDKMYSFYHSERECLLWCSVRFCRHNGIRRNRRAEYE